MKNFKKILINSKIFSKVCISQPISLVEKNNFHFLLGYRQSLFSVINPKFFQYSLKTSFLFVESFKKQNFKFYNTVILTVMWLKMLKVQPLRSMS